MRVAIIGSRHAPEHVDQLIRQHLPASVSEIVSGGANGIDKVAKALAADLGIPFREFLPDYAAFGKSAPIKRNDAIIAYADMVLAFWDGKSKGTQYVIGECLKKGICVMYIPLKGEDNLER